VNLHLLENFRALRFGPGALTKNLWALIGLLAVAAIAIFVGRTPQMIYVSLGIAVGAYLFYHLMNFLTMRAHPQLALLEGMELADYYRSSQGALGKAEVSVLPGVENPSEPPRLTQGGLLSEDVSYRLRFHKVEFCQTRAHRPGDN
jgi:hypothetical protein